MYVCMYIYIEREREIHTYTPFSTKQGAREPLPKMNHYHPKP